MRFIKSFPFAAIAGSSLLAAAIILLVLGLKNSSTTASHPESVTLVAQPVEGAVIPAMAANAEPTRTKKSSGAIPGKGRIGSVAGGSLVERDGHQMAHYAGTIKGSLFEAAAAQGVPMSVMAEFVHVFSFDVDFQRDIQPGDRFELLAERTTDSEGHSRSNTVLFGSLTLSGETLTAYRYVDSSGNSNYYSAKGESLKKGLLKTPVAGADISSGFGMRVNPVLGFSMLHKGVDFAVMTGTPVMAAGDGVVEVAEMKGAYGRYLKIRHDDVHATAYAHLSRYAKGIHPGSHVTQGQVVAYSGTTGRSTGPHLHYEVLVNNQQVNPMKVKFPAHFKLSGHELARFLTVVQETGHTVAEIPVTTKMAADHGAMTLN